MKNLILGCVFLTVVSILSLTTCFAHSRDVERFNFTSEIYKWQKVIEPGKGCFQEKCANGQYLMAVVPLVAFDNKLFIVGKNAVWTSSDGINWNSQPKTDWGERHGMAYVFFDNKIWMMGGMKSWGNFKNDVWYSGNGKDWKMTTANAPWTPRRGHSVLVFDNKMWLLGGSEGASQEVNLPSRNLNDIWSSKDGVNWKRETANAAWLARGEQTAFIFKNKMWVIGGTGQRDVWASVNGREWTQVTAEAGWSERQNNGGLVIDGKMWIFGGRGLNDVWNSTDGKKWELVFSQAPWSTRTTNHSIVFDNKLWIFSGKTGREDSWEGDVWTMISDEKPRQSFTKTK